MEEFLTEKESETVTNKCPSCGAELTYDIESGNLKCDHCGTTKVIDGDETAQRRALTDEIMKTRENWSEGSVFRCQSCGAKEVLDKKDIAKACPFCGNTHIVAEKELPGIKPDSVIPFQITMDSAINKFKEWIKKRWFAPKALKRADIRERMNAIYSPCWSFSAKTESNYSGTLGRTTVTRDSQGRTHTKVRWFRVSGQMNENYTDYFVQSGDRISAKLFGKIKPFNMGLLKVYRQEYLSGIIAEHYSRTLEICFNDFSLFVKRDIRQRIMRKHSADRVQFLNINTNYSDKKFNYILLPIYVSNYNYNKKTFNFFVNGADGKVVGYYPKSRLKIWLAVLGGIILVGAAVVGAYLAGVF